MSLQMIRYNTTGEVRVIDTDKMLASEWLSCDEQGEPLDAYNLDCEIGQPDLTDYTVIRCVPNPAHRYQVRVIGEAGQRGDRTVQTLKTPMLTTDDLAEAKHFADEQAPYEYYGVAIVDCEAGTVDWGDEVTPIVNGVVTMGDGTSCVLFLES